MDATKIYIQILLHIDTAVQMPNNMLEKRNNHQQIVLEKLEVYTYGAKLDWCLLPWTKIHSKGSNVEENICSTLHDICIGKDFMSRIPFAKELRSGSSFK